MDRDPVRVDDLGFALQREDQRPANPYNAERLIGSIENQCSSQGALSI